MQKMNHKINRRDFLKLAGAASLGLFTPPLIQNLGNNHTMQGGRKNVLVVVFDALSALNISLYGYGRETMPNLSKLAKRAVVYHNHFAAGNFTTPGTASLLTMTLPWTHRAFRFDARVRESLADKSVFNAFGDYHRIAYTHNPLANTLLKQFRMGIDEYVPRETLFINNDGLIRDLFSSDEDIATVGWARAMKRKDEGYSYSLFSSHLYEQYQNKRIAKFKEFYPNGLPSTNGDNYYTLEDSIDWLQSRLETLPQPFFGYFHFFPPHFPYKPRVEFGDHFVTDSWKPLDKPQDLFTEGNAYETLAKSRAYYDEFILNVDSEFGRLFDRLESSGILENTWVVFTSDHGEMQERGISGHTTPTLYQPIVRIPLFVFEPGRETGQDVYAPTSAVDVMTTLLHVTGHDIPAWSEGSILAPYTPQASRNEKSVYSVQARRNDPAHPLTEATVVRVEENYKLIYYLGYDQLGEDGERLQLFDVWADPEELNDLSATKKSTASELLNMTLAKLEEVNEPFSKRRN
ncbi:MAG: hypothetical protein C4583_08770 [Anaerolineaceae bacterium]|jgi:arylsulfatase A-like enzyme|nr:MAG: hypothetical protein C4583_08770 [Anaerolineaceae bacterium]